MRISLTTLAVLSFGLVVVGCAKPHPRTAASSPRGESSYRALAEAEVSAGAPDPSAETTTAIFPMAENATPEYPAAALARGCGDRLVAVRVHIARDGGVWDVERVPGRQAAEDACTRELEAAVRKAVTGWKYVPAYVVRQIPAETPGAPPRVERTPLALSLDYEFQFSVVDGRGEVRPK